MDDRLMDISRLVKQQNDEVIRLRRDFHRHPELGLQEHRTAEKVSAYLNGLDLGVERLDPTGVVGLLQGGRPGPTLLMRADMDALPITEKTSLSFKSQVSGVMHACGHDAHMAILLAAARVLCALRGQLAGNIKFVFQPNEENVGALDMIKAGVMEDPKVDACTGLHVWSPLPVGSLAVSAGPVMAGMEHFELTVKGKGGHTATPQSAIDPILAAAAVIQGVQVIQTRMIDPLKEPTIIMFGTINGGTASNVIPDSVNLSGTMRYLFEGESEGEKSPKTKLEKLVADICRTHGAGYELDFVYGHPTLVNHPEMAELVRQTALEVDEPPELTSLVTLAGEDFSEFSSRAPGVFYFLGAGNAAKGCDFPHHHPCFDIDESCLLLGVEMHVRNALGFFNKAEELACIRTKPQA